MLGLPKSPIDNVELPGVYVNPFGDVVVMVPLEDVMLQVSALSLSLITLQYQLTEPSPVDFDFGYVIV